ncbi:protein FAR-RED ELONGATED HYPOCOTYL 3-like [Arachis stenosperma]|uniref:protein FAR-RED ELONGATED HYPOCOTYL 3-like n=1 Tax=Arachis stenosperma TaxID=217475 RepID=UPI0025AD47FD|nr:protein FAR-RED ELONGATED HYPOCOTYL 3-like [Arachis stenosperma]
MEIMCVKKPAVVVTDGDKAMIKAVSEVLPSATHRLCAWHVEKNVTSNVKDVELRGLFRRRLYAEMGKEDFESEWDRAVSVYGLREKQWSCHMYDKKHMWASPYLRDKFCAGYRTTSRCEGINAHVNKFSKSTHTIYELVQSLEMVAREYRYRELQLQFQSINSVPIMTTYLTSIERHAATIYTREMFRNVKKEIERVGTLNQINKRRILTTMVYTIEEYENPNVQITTSYGRSTRKVSCQCNLWSKHGYPCKHMFFVLKAGHLKKIPDTLILRRWRADAKTPEQLALFQKAMRGIQSLCKELEMDYKAFHGGVRVTGENVGAADAVVRDPVVAQPKGAPKLGKRKGHCIRRCCSCCKGTGHTKRTCPAKGDNDDNQGWRDNPCGGNDSDMADRDDEDLCDDMYFDPNGTGDNA